MPYRLDKQTIAADFEALQDEHVTHYRESLLDLVRAFQKASALKDFFDVQLKLLAQYAARQSVVEERRSALSRERARLRELVRERPRPLGRVRELQHRMDLRLHQERRDDILSFALRELADGIAWRLLRFERRAFAVLGDGPRVDRLAAGVGFATELERIAELWEQHGLLALHNDLTTCLRYGDLTVLLGADAEAGVGIEEVKAAGQRGMRPKQTERLDARLDFLKSNFQARGADGMPVSLQQLPVQYRTHSQDLAAVLARARAQGYADAQPEPALILAAVDYTQLAGREAELGQWPWRLARERGWTLQDDFHHSRIALQTRMQERHGNLSYFAPVTIFPLPAEDLTDLLLGGIDYAVTLRAHCLPPAFARAGIEIELPTGRDAEREFLRASRAGETLTFPLHLRDQMLRELMSSETLVAIADCMLSALAAGASVDMQRMLFCDEREAWPSPPVYLGAPG
jgi:hypothetical protein